MTTARRWTAAVSRPAMAPRKSICLTPPFTVRLSLAVCGVASSSVGFQKSQPFSAAPSLRARVALPMKSASELIEAASTLGGVTAYTEAHSASAWPPTNSACGPHCARISRTSSVVRATSWIGSVTQFRCRPADACAPQGLRLDQHHVLGRERAPGCKLSIARLRRALHLPKAPAGNDARPAAFNRKRQPSCSDDLAQKQADGIAHFQSTVGEHSSRSCLQIGLNPGPDHFCFHGNSVATLGYSGKRASGSVPTPSCPDKSRGLPDPAGEKERGRTSNDSLQRPFNDMRARSAPQ
jgi:hypothetical protein